MQLGLRFAAAKLPIPPNKCRLEEVQLKRFAEEVPAEW
jgi:hypothetical protein